MGRLEEESKEERVDEAHGDLNAQGWPSQLARHSGVGGEQGDKVPPLPPQAAGGTRAHVCHNFLSLQTHRPTL
jgi:hypothetical protein